jgi:serine/threonine-protein kinase
MADSASATRVMPDPIRIAQRYQVIKPLGQGGMAHVYHVADAVSGRELALKQLSPQRDAHRDALVSQFEAEFNALAQLSHPRVIEVYDYGLTETGPFFTMELLDGGDLAERSPMAWREACGVIYDVCSSLALLHSRRFVHRDVSPRNVRCTRDGRAKLIDFGTMVPMGASNFVAGTPAFVAPEVVHRSALDGRADLFSLGATLYYALAKRPPHSARGFLELSAAWSKKPRPPSAYNPEIPAALDALVMSLLSLDPTRRPRNAYEVMQRLSAIAGLEREETDVSQAYLSTPTLVARESVLAALTRQVESAKKGRGSACLLRAESGVGRSRVLDACVLEAKAHGAIVLRVSATAAGVDLAVAQALADQLLEALGERAIASATRAGSLETLFEAVPDREGERGSAEPPPRLQLKRFAESAAAAADAVADAFLAWLLDASRRQLCVIAVDDMQRCDQPSASLLAALAAQLERHRSLLVLTIDNSAPSRAPDAMTVLAEHCLDFGLEALTRAETEELLSSIFGAVPNLGALTAAVDELASGNPRKILDVAQHLVDRGALRYADGSWTLPERIDPSALPRSAEDAVRERLAGLDSVARFLVEAHALSSFDSCSRDDYLKLRPDAEHKRIDHALLALLSHEILVRDGAQYAFARRSWASLLCAELDDAQRRERHRALARLYEQRSAIASARHLFAAGERALGLDRLYAVIKDARTDSNAMWELSGRMRPAELIDTFESGHRAAVELDRPVRERVVIQGWIVGISLIVDDAYYERHADQWRKRLEYDSGYTIYRELEGKIAPANLLTQALTLLSQRYAATPEVERGYAPEDAIRVLVSYVGVSIAIGSRSYNRALLHSLPPLLEPFAPLSRVIEAIRLNSIGSRNLTDSRIEQARAGWIDVYERLGQISEAELPSVAMFRAAIAHTVGLVETRLGLRTAKDWAERIERDPTQRVNARYLRKVDCLNHGDFEGAERWRKQAEILALQAPMRQMFTSVVTAELFAHAAVGDLVGVKQSLERIVPLSERYPNWIQFRILAEALFQSVRGDLAAACVTFERCLALCAPDLQQPQRSYAAWPAAVGAYVDTLCSLGRYEDARRIATEALARCGELGIDASSHEIARALALAEARLGDHAGAWARLEQLIEAKTKLGASGLQLGGCYETCARIAIWMGDKARLQHYAHLTATEYRYGHGSPLGARYERLMDEARQSGVGSLPELADFVPTSVKSTLGERDTATTRVLESMSGAVDRHDRTQRALGLLCKARGARIGHLFLYDARGIELAASYGTAEPPAGLRDFLERYLRIELEQTLGATTIAHAPEPDSTLLSRWSDPLGNVHQPWVLVGRVAGAVRQIGIASLVIDDTQVRRANDPQLCSALVAYLIESGVVREQDCAIESE